MIEIRVILDPNRVNYCPGEALDAFLQNEVVSLVKEKFNQGMKEMPVRLNIIKAVKTVGTAAIQTEVRYSVGYRSDPWANLRLILPEKIGSAFVKYQGFGFSSPPLTLSVDCMPQHGEGSKTFTNIKK